MGGRGSSGGSGGGVKRYKGAAGAGIPISATSLVSQREDSPELVDETLETFRDVNSKYGYVIEDIELATMGPGGESTIAYYMRDAQTIGINKSYFNAGIQDAYDECVKSGFHPGRGNKTALQAVTAHELGHALTEDIANKAGFKSMDDAAKQIVNEAKKATGHKGVVIMASKISEYATANNAETIAEAFADVYCNGKKAKKESQAIMKIVDSYY